MNMANLVVLKGLVAQKTSKTPQLFRVSLETADITKKCANLLWYNVQANGASEDEPFASANLYYEDADGWLNSWSSSAHLVQGRIDTLKSMAREGTANQFSHKMAYTLFANSLVDYAQKYRGMQSVTMHELEAFAEVTLQGEGTGRWTVPPHYIDSVAHLAGFIMNVSEAMDTKGNFCVTPGWQSMRFARPFVAGAKYTSYAKMIPTVEDPSIYMGDVYIMQDGAIVGMVGGITFRRYPRILLTRFFSAPDGHTTSSAKVAPAPKKQQPSAAAPQVQAPTKAPTPAPVPAAQEQRPTLQIRTSAAPAPAPVPAPAPAPVPETEQVASENEDSVVPKALALIAREACISVSDLHDEASFGNLGLDSLLSLVVAEKFREELGITANGGIFLTFPTVGDLKVWLKEYYD